MFPFDTSWLSEPTTGVHQFGGGSAFQKWLWGTPQVQAQVLQGQPPLSKEAEALFVEFQQHMDKQYQMNILARYVLTLPALPEEGY